MGRPKRQWVCKTEGCYHLISRIVGGEFLLGDVEKEYFLHLLTRMASAFFIEIHTFAIMSNHFHILASGSEEEALLASKEELIRRYRLMYPKNPEPPEGSENPYGEYLPDEDGGIERLRRRLGSISCFTKELKQNFSHWYNKTNDRKGFLWGGRFKGIIISIGEIQLECSAYIDLNPVRANIVKRPEDYRWCSLGLRVRQPGLAKKLLRPLNVLPSFKDFEKKVGGMAGYVRPSFQPRVISKKASDSYANYRDFVYAKASLGKPSGSSIKPGIYDEVVAYHKNFGIAHQLRFRIKNFSEGVALGNYELIVKLQKAQNRKHIRPRPLKGEESDCTWAYTTRVLRS